MRRALALLLALTVCAAAGLVCAHRAVGASAQAVELYETALFGDAEAARGVAVSMPLECGGQLFWESVFCPGTDGAPETDFRFSAVQERRGWGVNAPMGLNVSLMMNRGGGGNFGQDFDRDEVKYYNEYFFRLYGDLLRDVASRTAPGSEHAELADLRDWMDRVPLEFTMDGGGGYWGYFYEYEGAETSIEGSWGDQGWLSAELAERFVIPLETSVMVRVSIAKNPEGDIVDWNVDGVYPDSPDLPEGTDVEALPVDPWEGLQVYSYSVVTDEACYFVFEQGYADRELGLVDFSSLPGGRGVYCLPLEWDEERGGTRLYLDDISVALPVDDGEAVELMDIAGDRLIMLTQDGSTLYLTQARLPGLTDVRKTALASWEGELESSYAWERAAGFGNLYCVETENDRVILLESVDGGDYEICLDVPDYPREGVPEDATLLFDDITYRMSYDSSPAMLWDGERFLMARWCRPENSDIYIESGVLLWVYDQTGLLYCGRFDSSLSSPPTEMYNNNARASGELGLEWG